jgi:hypothetical protein
VTELRGRRVVLRPLEADDAPVLRALAATPEVVEWWGEQEEGFPLEPDPESTRVMRSAWRDPTGAWRDVLLMEHVAR